MLFWCARISTRQDHRTGAECGAGNGRGDSTHSDELSDEEEEEEAEEVTARPHAAQGREGGRRERREGAQLPPARGRKEEGGREDGRTNVVVVELTKRGKINRPIITRFATDGRTVFAAACGRWSARGWRSWQVSEARHRDNSPRVSLRNSSFYVLISRPGIS